MVLHINISAVLSPGGGLLVQMFSMVMALG